MKMPEKHDLLAAILAAKEQASGQSCVFVAYLRGRYNGGAFTKTVIGTTICIIAWFIHDLLLPDKRNLAYITACLSAT